MEGPFKDTGPTKFELANQSRALVSTEDIGTNQPPITQ